MNAQHPLVETRWVLRLWLHCRNVLLATVAHTAGVAAAIVLLRSLVARLFEAAFVSRSFYSGLSLRLFIVLHLFFKNAIPNLLAKSLHALQLLSSDSLLWNAKALSSWAACGLRKVLQEVSGKTDGFQFRQLGFFNGRQIVLLENLILRSQSRDEIQEPSLVRHVRFINTSKNEVLIPTYLVELLQQHFNSWWARTWQHLHFGIFWAKCLSQKNVSHVFLSNHCRLILRQVVTIALYGLIEIFAVLDDAREVIYRHLHIVAWFHHR